MNYLEIVLQGYLNENNREFLGKYFLREFKKAEKEYYDAKEFFNGLFKIIEVFKENQKKQYIEIQSELNNYLVSVKKEDIDNEFIQQQKKEIEFLKINGVTNLRLSNDSFLILSLKEISYIEQSIIEAFETVKVKNEVLPLQINKEESRTRKVIYDAFEGIDKQGWRYAFVYEKDFNLFTDLLTNFFEYKQYTLPETTIQLKRTCKTRVSKVLGEIHKELSNENTLTNDEKYFQLIKVLSHFEKENKEVLYKALTR